MTDLVLDPGKSRVRIRTYAEGLFARLAHDVELTCTKLSGRATRAEGIPPSGTANVEVPIGGIDVVGYLHGGRVDEGRKLLQIERDEILSKMRKDAFHSDASAVVRVEATLEGGSARVKIVPPNGTSVEHTVRPKVTEETGAVRLEGTFDLSLKAIGSSTVKGPMNAFRVKDRVEILFEVVFAPGQGCQPGQPA